MRRSFKLRRQDGEYLMVPGNFTIGRSSSCDLTVDDPLVSRVHAVIRVGIDSASIEDAGSHNGVFVNGARLDEPRPLVHGDRIGIGAAELELCSTERLGQRNSRARTMSKHQVAIVDAARSAQKDAGQAALGRLSAREREVLVMVARGHTMREVGERLDLSPKTVEGYRARVGNKLGLRSRADFLELALRAGLLGP